MADKSLKDISGEIHDLLEPLTTENRRRVIKSALSLLEDDASDALGEKERAGAAGGADDNDGGGANIEGVSPRAKTWMKQNGITSEMLTEVFDLEHGMSFIGGDVPGSAGKQKTINCYVLTGTAGFLRAGELKFSDADGRELCKAIGCFSNGNHARYIGARGKVFGGSKEAGWTLTEPGKKAAAELIKTMATAG